MGVREEKWLRLPNDFEKILVDRLKMGGIGSGRRSSYGLTTESVKRVDLRWMVKQDYIPVRGSVILSKQGILHYSYAGQASGSISYEVNNQELTLRYRHRNSLSGEWRDIQEVVPFDR